MTFQKAGNKMMCRKQSLASGWNTGNSTVTANTKPSLWIGTELVIYRGQRWPHSSPWSSVKRKQWSLLSSLHRAAGTTDWGMKENILLHPQSSYRSLSLKQDIWSFLDGTLLIVRKVTVAFTKPQTHSLLMMRKQFLFRFVFLLPS